MLHACAAQTKRRRARRGERTAERTGGRRRRRRSKQPCRHRQSRCRSYALCAFRRMHRINSINASTIRRKRWQEVGRSARKTASNLLETKQLPRRKLKTIRPRRRGKGLEKLEKKKSEERTGAVCFQGLESKIETTTLPKATTTKRLIPILQLEAKQMPLPLVIMKQMNQPAVAVAAAAGAAGAFFATHLSRSRTR